MKSSSILLTLTSLTASILAAPTAAPIDYTPPGGWESVKYPAGTGANLPYYPPPPGGWENVKYPAGTGAAAGAAAAAGGAASAIANLGGNVPGDMRFTSRVSVVATPDQVIATNQSPAPGQGDAVGIFNYGLNSETNTICYSIFLINVRGDYSSPARTATHIHEAVRGRSGPPRIAFPNPAGTGPFRQSSGCLTGPFVTGVKAADGVTDTGAGFTIKKLEENLAGFFTDSHTVDFTAGVVRGQLA